MKAYVVYGLIQGEGEFDHHYFSTDYAAKMFEAFWNDEEHCFDSIETAQVAIEETTCQEDIRELIKGLPK